MNTETHARINNPREREKNVSYQKRQTGCIGDFKGHFDK